MSTQCTLKRVKRGEACLGTTRCCLSTSCCFSSPITWRAETPLASSRAKRHFKCALQRGLGLCSQSILRGSFEGNLSSEPLVAARCLFVCLNPFYSLLATVLRWRWQWGGARLLLQKFHYKKYKIHFKNIQSFSVFLAVGSVIVEHLVILWRTVPLNSPLLDGR